MKRYTINSLILMLLVAILPSTAFADFAFIWSPPAEDKSIEYLGNIFGTVGTALTGTGSSLIGNLFYIFNIAVLSLGSIVVSYTIILSTMNTAQEGEVMGRKWSSIWIPLRCAVGMAFLLPTASGYSLVQVMMMQFVLYGVAAADQIWSVVVNNMEGGTTATSSVSMSDSALRSTAQGLLNSMVCARVLNSDPTCKAAIGNQTVTAYSSGNTVNIGIQGDPNYATVCGTVKAGSAPHGVDSAQWQAANIAAIQSAAGQLSSTANTIYQNGPSAVDSNALNSAVSTLRGTISSANATSIPTTDNSDTANFGWLFAGSYYFELNKEGGKTTNYASPTSTGGNTSSVGTGCNTQLSNYRGQTSTALSNQTTSSSNSSSSASTLELQPANISQPEVLEFYNELVSPVQDLTFSLLNTLTTNSGDPISSLRTVGSDIINTTENIWFSIMALGFLVLIVGCISSGMISTCWAIGAIISILMPVLTILLILLWGAGITIGLYLPLVPYLVFTFTALGWFLLVIETIAAAPVVALGLVSPAAENLGKAAPAVLLITNVFLRPSLMVIGFVVAIFLTQAAINMVNFGFQATIEASVGGLGIFGCIALICLYGGFVITIVHECFSLVYVLPDKIIRWIGGQAEQSSVKGSVQEVKGAAEKGAETGSALMKGSSSMMQEKVSQKTSSGGGGPSIGGLAS